jgi:catechol 2,3-dioxygenase-like lactoylglutathione lyase family enzyme
MADLELEIRSTVLGSPDPRALGAFYAQLLGWEVLDDEPEWVKIKPLGGGHGLAFQLEAHHARPAWPAGPGEQQMQLHLDIGATDLDAGVARAEALGARLAAYQPQDDVRVMLDPDGHPFCLFQPPA